MISKESKSREGARREGARRDAAFRTDRRRSDRRRHFPTLLAGLGIALVIGLMVLVRTWPGAKGSVVERQPVPGTVMQALASISPDVSNQIGPGTAQGRPVVANGPLLTGPAGRPEILYVGAEYCPYCAAERWALVVALSRFGTFDNLRLARSASDDVYPATPTFTFVGSTYRSPYLEFRAIELQSSQRVGDTYQTLETPTPDEEALISKYDAPPYVPASQAGAIPFIDVANRFIITGSGFSPGLLDQHSWEAISANLSNPNSEQARAIVGTANVLTAAICQATGQTPSNVCGQLAIRQIAATLPGRPPAGSTG